MKIRLGISFDLVETLIMHELSKLVISWGQIWYNLSIPLTFFICNLYFEIAFFVDVYLRQIVWLDMQSIEGLLECHVIFQVGPKNYNRNPH